MRRLLIFIVLLFSIGSLLEAYEPPTIITLAGYPTSLTTDESVNFIYNISQSLEQSGIVKPITAETDNLFWKSLPLALDFSHRLNTDYMLYVNLSKTQGYYSYDAVLVRSTTYQRIAVYAYTWKDEPLEEQKAIKELSSRVTFDISGKITVNITIRSVSREGSHPLVASIYRDNDCIGHTDKDGFFIHTVWWNKGRYQIKLCSLGYRNELDTIVVESNPTDYQKTFKFEKE